MSEPRSRARTVFQDFSERGDPALVAPRLAALRAELARRGLDGLLIPRADAHQGEYVPDREARLAYVTGFTGSAGLAVVARDAAGLFVDARYAIQAPRQTDTALFEVLGTPRHKPAEWLLAHVPPGARVGFDPWLHTPEQIAAFRKVLDPHRIALVPADDPVAAIWADRPPAPAGALEFLDPARTGQETAQKLGTLRATLLEAGADALVLTLPDSICWLFNIRGRDIPHNPVALAFALVPAQGLPTLFLESSKLTEENRAAFSGLAELAQTSALAKTLSGQRGTVWLDPASAPLAVEAALEAAGARLLRKRDPLLLPKARKNPVELSGMRQAQRLDAIAMIRFLAWFDGRAPQGGLTEIGIVEKLEALRRDHSDLVDISFETIAGSGPNGAITHHRVTEKSDRALAPGELLVLDSGGQYRFGTTDITRTLAAGPVPDPHKEHVTRVLKGMIAISRAKFPAGTSGARIDVLARQFLWEIGLDYGHGTGHGVGAYLSVHEGPAGISQRHDTPLEAGMVLSNEPGYYLENSHGIRIENLVAVVESPVGADFLEFETLTFVPIDTSLVLPGLLTPVERDWLNAYHAETRRRAAPDLAEAERLWLETATAPI